LCHFCQHIVGWLNCKSEKIMNGMNSLIFAGNLVVIAVTLALIGYGIGIASTAPLGDTLGYSLAIYLVGVLVVHVGALHFICYPR